MSRSEQGLNPFPGLRSFEPDEDLVFFGRQKQTDNLLWRLRSTRFLPVVGVSGSGKSSLVRSGVVPSLYSGYMLKAGSSWRVALLRPGENPIGNLAEALHTAGLRHETSGSEDAILQPLLEATLRASAQGLVQAVRQTRIPPQDNVLVVVDQFEELFRFQRSSPDQSSRDEALAFVKLMLEAAGQTEVPIYVALTLRSEMLGSCSAFPGLPETINRGVYLVPRMSREELREAIVNPIVVAGGEIAPRLVTRLLNDVSDDPDQLPLLQHVLMRMWDHREEQGADGPIDLDAYRAVGTVSEALSRHAEEAYAELGTDGERRIAAVLFKALSEHGPDRHGMRRPISVTDACELTGAELAEVVAVSERFRRAGRCFLLPAPRQDLAAGSILDLAHECVLRAWGRLVRWTEEEARSAQMYERVAQAAALHRRGEAGLWRDPDLHFALEWRREARPTAAWARRYEGNFSEAMGFLDESGAQQQEETVRLRVQVEDDRRRDRRGRFARGAALGLAAAALLAFGFGYIVGELRTAAARQEALTQQAVERAERAERRADRAERELRRLTGLESARQLARRALQIGAAEPAALVALQAYRLHAHHGGGGGESEVRRALLEALARLTPGARAAPAEALAAQICARVSRRLTPEERSRYLPTGIPELASCPEGP